MSILIASGLAAAISLAGLFYLLAINDKRRRSLGLPKHTSLPRSPMAGWGVFLAPGLALAAASMPSAFLVWFGGVTVSAWIISARGRRLLVPPNPPS